MLELRLEETDQVAGAMSLVYRYVVTKAYQVTDAAFKDITGATWGDGGIGQISGYIDAA